jgi:peroxiredoxin
MKVTRAIVFAALVVALCASVASAGADRLAIGQPAPMADVVMKNIDGGELSITGAAGEYGTLVMFSCNSCGSVLAYQDRIAMYLNKFQEAGVGVIVINPNDPAQAEVDSFEGMQQRAKELGFEFPYVVDATSDVARAFGATRTPEVFLFDADGLLVYTGGIDDSKGPEQVTETYMADAVNALISGDEIAVKESRSLG